MYVKTGAQRLVCSGKGMAKDCTSDRVLLSAHMEEHWEKVGHRPDIVDLNEVDELDIQIGRKEPEPTPANLLRPDHSGKYTYVLIRGGEGHLQYPAGGWSSN